MIVVIFRAKLRQIDQDYQETGQKMHDLAKDRYHCLGMTSFYQNNQELTLSYWENMDDLTAWRRDPDHILAQKRGSDKWYEWHQVEIATIERAYNSLSTPDHEKLGRPPFVKSPA